MEAMNQMKTHTLIILTIVLTFLCFSCATNERPPCRKVSAAEFMRPHTFKGIATDDFIGTTSGNIREDRKAFKKIWELGLNHSWAVLWCPVDELPQDYLATAHEKPYRVNGNQRINGWSPTMGMPMPEVRD